MVFIGIYRYLYIFKGIFISKNNFWKKLYFFVETNIKKIHQTSPRDSPDDFKKSKKNQKKNI